MNEDIVTRLRELLDYKDGGWPSDSLAWLLADAANLIEAIEDAMSEWDGYNGDDIAARIHVLLHPDEEARRG